MWGTTNRKEVKIMGLKEIARMVNEHNREKDLAEEFGLYFNEAIVRIYQERNRGRKPSRNYKPSSLGGCLRNNYFQLIGADLDKENNSTVTGIGMAESGTDRHKRLQDVIVRMEGLGYPIKWVDIDDYLKSNSVPGTVMVSKKGYEYKLKNDIYKISFLSDGVIKIRNKVYSIIEIKTEASFKWRDRISPEENHIVQAACYSLCLGIDNVIFIYENRDFCNKKYFLYKVTEEDKQGIIDIIETCNNYVRENVVPPKTDNEGNCTYCQYKEICKIY
jgi:CRISPR/Cas system-associated exonuclease Cas4 (RecB family)